MFKKECDDLAQTVRSLTFVKSLPRSIRGDKLISSIEVYLGDTPSLPSQVIESNRHIISSLENEIGTLKTRIAFLLDSTEEDRIVYVERPRLSFKQKILSLIPGLGAL